MKIKLFLPLLLLCSYLSAQNIAITDDDSYSPKSSAMLDVMSTTKGMLVPRVTTSQRNLIVSPEQGLLVFDTDEVSFYFYNGSSWINLSHGNASGIWNKSGESIYLSSDNYKVGINKQNPLSALEVKANANADADDPLFQVINKNGDTVFAVYSDGVAISFDESAPGNIGGFAVSGKNTTKGTRDYLRISTDSTRIYLNESVKGNIGGFAVSGRNTAKGAYDEFLRVTPDSTRVWVRKTSKGNIGGFAVSGRNTAKGMDEDIFVTTFDSTRIYVDQQAKGNIGGFAVSGRSTSKGAVTPFMDMTEDNYFIGHESGINISSATYNSTMGYQSGKSLLSGSNNCFFGNLSGTSNTYGNSNIFIGSSAGQSNTSGHWNVFVGHESGKENRIADYNTFIGYQSGQNNNISGNNTPNGSENVFIGHQAGKANDDGYRNVFIGPKAGTANTTGNYNIFIGREAGMANETGTSNIYIGEGSGDSHPGGTNNTFVGKGTGAWQTAGGYNVYLGGQAAIYKTSGERNVHLGYHSGAYAKGDDNILIGYQAGSGHIGSGNIVIGKEAGDDLATDESNKLYIENSDASRTESLIFGDFSSNYLRFNANVAINAAPTTSYQLYVAETTVSSDRPAIYAIHDITDNYGVAVKGRSRYRAIVGEAVTASGNGYGIYGYAAGTGTGNRYGVYGYATGGTTSYAGYFSGNVHVSGTLSKSAGSFKIDHPLDPENKYLVHSFVESPDMMNIYNGVVKLDSDGKAVVQLPEYFEELNKDFRYQLTAIGAPGPNLYIEKKIDNNQFSIAGGQPNMEVSWEITGVRKDPYAEQNRIVVEQEKEEKGKYLNPELYGKSKDFSIHERQKK